MLEGKVAVVTGASRGIGREVALTLAGYGATVIVNYCGSKDKAEAVVEEIAAAGGTAKAYQGDVSEFDVAKEMMTSVKKEFGSIDILVNNAGITKDNLILKMSEEEFDKVIEVNLKGAFNCMKHVSRIMLKQRYGHIINMSSVSGIFADYSMAAYNAAKGGVTNLTRAIAIDYADQGIRANAICPGAVQTEMLVYTFRKIPYAEKVNREAYPTHTFASPEEIAEVALFLASRKVDFLNGTNIPVDGGITCHTGQPKY